MKIVLHIDRLVLEGFPAMDATRLGEVIERELSMSLGALPTVRWTGATADCIARPLESAAPIDNHAALGRSVARALQSVISATQPGARVSAGRDGGPS